jgi:sialidase-1
MDFQVLATRGVGGYRQYRIPAMAVTPSGKIIAIYDGRADLDDLPGPVDLVCRTSQDNGETWSPQNVFLASHGITGFGDASILVDPTVGDRGRIIVLCQTSKLASFFESSPGVDVNDPTIVHISLSYSDDDGESWNHEIITNQVKESGTDGIFATSGMGGRITSGEYVGRLIHSFVIRRGGELLSALAMSDDHGLTWRLGAEIPSGNETAVASLKDGSILFHSRSTPYRISGRSLDGGETLAEYGIDKALPDPSDNGSLCVLKNGDVICSHNHDTDLRRRTVVKKSHDGGVSWPEAVIVEPESSAYSTSCELKDGRIGILFERHGYAEIVFCRIQQEDFKSTEVILPIEKNESDIGFDVILRYVKPSRDEIALRRISQEVKARIPKIDMSAFRPSERKEIGSSSGSAGGDPVFTKAEFDQILGDVTPGLHLGDEIRFSGRLMNHSQGTVTSIRIFGFDQEIELKVDKLLPGEKVNFLDLRYIVKENDLKTGIIYGTFSWQALKSDDSSISGAKTLAITTATGLPIS